MAAFWKTFLLLVACTVTMVASRGHHRHRHGFQHLKKHLHRLHLKHLKEKLLSTVMPSTVRPIQTTEKYEIPEVTTESPATRGPPKHLLAEAEVDQKIDAFPDPFPTDNLKLNIAEDETDSEETIWGKPLPKQKDDDKWISYDELKKDFKYDDKSILPILDKPIYEVNDVKEPGLQEKGFSPVSMPKRFVSYDKNRDGFISMKELQKVTGAVENSVQAFVATDKDGDGYISPEEFMAAPWILEDDPDQNAKLEETRSFLKARMERLDDQPSEEDNSPYAEDWYPLNDD